MSRYEMDPEQADAELQHARDDVDRLIRLRGHLSSAIRITGMPIGPNATASHDDPLAKKRDDGEREREMSALDDELGVADDHLARTVRYWLG